MQADRRAAEGPGDAGWSALGQEANALDLPCGAGMCAVRLGYEFFVRAELRIPEPPGMSWDAQALESFVVAQMIFSSCDFDGFVAPIESAKASLRGPRGLVFRRRRIDVALKRELIRATMLRTVGEVGERHSSNRHLVAALDGWLPEPVAKVLLGWD